MGAVGFFDLLYLRSSWLVHCTRLSLSFFNVGPHKDWPMCDLLQNNKLYRVISSEISKYRYLHRHFLACLVAQSICFYIARCLSYSINKYLEHARGGSLPPSQRLIGPHRGRVDLHRLRAACLKSRYVDQVSESRHFLGALSMLLSSPEELDWFL